MRCGGGRNHRIGLYDAVLVKDNHLGWLQADGVADPIAEAIAAARAGSPPGTLVEVEVDTLDQLDAALAPQARRRARRQPRPRGARARRSAAAIGRPLGSSWKPPEA